MLEHRAAVVGAAGFGGAVAAAILRRHPSIELTAVTARYDAGRRHDEIHPRYRVPLELEELDPRFSHWNGHLEADGRVSPDIPRL